MSAWDAAGAVVCPVCGASFTPPAWKAKHGRGRFCSKTCTLQNMRAVRWSQPVSEDVDFWPRVKRGAADECWPWQGSVRPNGYGKFVRNGRTISAHRHALTITTPPVEGNPQALHACDNPVCCNPAHLRWRTHQDNMNDKVARGRATGRTRLCGAHA